MTATNPSIDINCDMGEGVGNDALLMPYISSANIACGYHAGDAKTIWQSIELALQHRVSIGAHVSFLDRENFGRAEIDLPAEEIYELVTQQLIVFREIADSLNAVIHHVKPHGALYNISAREPGTARAIARAVADFNSELVLFGLSGSHSIREAKQLNLVVANETFADRSYQSDGTLTPRRNTGAVFENADQVADQAERLAKQSGITTSSGNVISPQADTICIHGDGPRAIEFAKSVNERMKKLNIGIKAV